MKHSEAVQQMAVERYLLGELPPEARDAFEEHFFDCQECALDLRAAADFIKEAKLQLPNLPVTSPAKPRPSASPTSRRRDWFSWWKPAFVVPVFAALLCIVGYQNLITIKALRLASEQPRLLPWVTLHGETRGSAPVNVQATRGKGVILLIDLPQNPAYTSFVFELYSPAGSKIWDQSVSASAGNNNGGPLSLLIPWRGLQEGSYTLTISGMTAQGTSTPLDRHTLDIQFKQ